MCNIYRGYIFIFKHHGSFKNKTSGSLIEDMPKKYQFYSDIVFFEKNLASCLPKLRLTPKRKKRSNETLYFEKSGRRND
jgi:hypothetical protein